jgi:TRAP-type C4-dicarboxylate transport system permease small subunit
MPNFIRTEKKIVSAVIGLSKLAEILSGATLVMMMVAIVLEVVIRQTPAVLSGFSGYATVRMLFPVLVFLGMGYTWCARSHVRVESILCLLPQIWQNLLNFFTLLGILAISSLMTWLTMKELIFSYTTGQKDLDTMIPLFYFKAFLPLGCFLLTLVVLLDLKGYVQHFVRGKSSSPYDAFNEPLR